MEMNWFFFAALSALSFAAFSVLIRAYLREKGNAYAFAALTNILAGTFLGIFSLFENAYIHISTTSVLLILLATILVAIMNSLFTRGRQLEKVSYVSIARQTSTIWSFIGGTLLLSESFSILKLAGIVLIVLGNIVALWENGSFRITRGLVFIFTGALILGGASLLNKSLVGTVASPARYGSILFIGGAFWIFTFLPQRMEKIKEEIRIQGAKIIYISLLLSTTIFLVMNAYRAGEVSNVVPIHNSGLVLSVLGGIIFLNERDYIPRKLLGALLAFAGILLLKP